MTDNVINFALYKEQKSQQEHEEEYIYDIFYEGGVYEDIDFDPEQTAAYVKCLFIANRNNGNDPFPAA